MKSLIKLMGLVVVFMLASCSTVHVQTDYDRSASFTSFKTYAFHQEGIQNLKMNDLDKRRVLTAITENLKQKGFTVIEDENRADVLINILAKTERVREINHWNMNMGWYGPWAYYGAYWQRPMVRDYKEGTLVIDLIDRKNNILVWESVGSGLNLYNLNQKGERITKAVDEILASYPPKP